MERSQGGSITVLGAGIVGICCGVWLQNRGFDVTLVDRDDPGSGTSFGNAGLIHVDGVVPVATPGILWKAPGMLFNPTGPLVIRWPYLPKIAPWLVKFVRAAKLGSVERISIAAASLLDQANDAWLTLVRQAGAGELWQQSGELHVYRTKSAWDAARFKNDLRRQRGSGLQELTVDEIRQMEPALTRDLYAGVFTPNANSVANPYGLSCKLVDLFKRCGGRIIKTNVTAMEPGPPGSPIGLIAESGRLEAEQLVVAAGAFSKSFARSAGVKVPLDTERGYHLWLPDPGVDLRRPVIVGDHFFAICPMHGGVRLAGMAEFAGLDLPPYWERADLLGDLAGPFVPGLNLEGSERWMGHRPALPDSLPVIGRAPGRDNIYLAFGHGHLGLTMAAVTGRLISELAAGMEPTVDLAPFRPNRF